MSIKAEKIDYQTGIGERVSYGLYFSGQLIFYGLLLSFLVPYFTDIGIPVLTVAAVTLAVKIWDAVNDPLFGGLVDKIRFKKGKFMPWIRISVIVIPITTVFLFAAPVSLSLGSKVAWVVIGYMLWDTAYTICDVPIFGLVTTMTNQVKERNFLMALTRIFSGIGMVLLMTALPLIRTRVGGWFPSAVIASLIGVLFMLPVLFTGKERYVNLVPEEGFGLAEILKYLRTNKYLLIYMLGFIISGIGGGAGIGQILQMYLARYNLGGESVMALLSLTFMVPSLAASLVVPFLIRKFDKFTLFFTFLVVNMVLGVVMYFVGYHNLTAFLVMSVLRGIAGGMITIFTAMFTPDILEYGHYKTGIPASGITIAAQTFSSKLMTALGTALAALCLSLIGFVEGEGAVQTTDFPDKLWFINCFAPMVFMLISIPIFTRYKLRDKYVAVMARFNNGEISREEADSFLEGKI